MEKLHRASDNSAITLSGLRGVILRSAAKMEHSVPGPDGKPVRMTVNTFSFHPSVAAEKVTVAWNNDKGLAVLEKGTADFLIMRKWGKEVPDDVLDWWNEQVEAYNADATVVEPVKASEPTPTPASEPEKKVEEPKQEEKKVEPVKAPAAEPEKDKKPAPAAFKPAATKDALARAEEEEKKLAGDKGSKPSTD